MKSQKSSMAKAVEQMDRYLREDLLRDKDGSVYSQKLWENTYIKKQIDRRKNGDGFLLEDHIRGMVYSLLSSGSKWDRMEMEVKTGRLLKIDEIFHQYDSEYILSCSPEVLTDEIKRTCGATQSTKKQMEALIQVNIPKLKKLEVQYGSIDKSYQKYMDEDETLKVLISVLSCANSNIKMNQMGEALIAEYLRNVGYDVAKPDRHIRRILGKNILGCSEHENVPVYEAIDIIREIADCMGKCAAEVDYILWSYCASGYGEVCTVQNPKCDVCVIENICRRCL